MNKLSFSSLFQNNVTIWCIPSLVVRTSLGAFMSLHQMLFLVVSTVNHLSVLTTSNLLWLAVHISCWYINTWRYNLSASHCFVLSFVCRVRASLLFWAWFLSQVMMWFTVYILHEFGVQYHGFASKHKSTNAFIPAYIHKLVGNSF